MSVCMYVCLSQKSDKSKNQKIKELFDYLINKSSWILFQLCLLFLYRKRIFDTSNNKIEIYIK